MAPGPPRPSPPALMILDAVPSGWQKQVTTTKKGKQEVSFVAPSGEAFKSKSTLDRYLKDHAGGPSASAFNWSSGQTPTRRSSRISSRTPPSIKVSEEGSARKRQRWNSDKDETLLEPITKDGAENSVAIQNESEGDIEGNERIRDEKMEDPPDKKGEETTVNVDVKDIKEDETVETTAGVEEKVEAVEEITTHDIGTNNLKDDEIMEDAMTIKEEEKEENRVEKKREKEETREEKEVNIKEASQVEDKRAIISAPIDEDKITTSTIITAATTSKQEEMEEEKKTEEVKMPCAEKVSMEDVSTKGDTDEGSEDNNNEKKFQKSLHDELNQKRPEQPQSISMPVHVST